MATEKKIGAYLQITLKVNESDRAAAAAVRLCWFARMTYRSFMVSALWLRQKAISNQTSSIRMS